MDLEKIKKNIDASLSEHDLKELRDYAGSRLEEVRKQKELSNKAEIELKYKGKYILCYGHAMQMIGGKNKNDIKIVYVEDTDLQGHGFFRCKAKIIQIKYNDEYNLVSHIGAEDYGEVYVSFEQDKQYSFYEQDIDRILTKEEVIEMLDEAKASQIDMMDEWKKCLQ
jgi:hypothetical protein